MTEALMHCPKCGGIAIKYGHKFSKTGVRQRWQCKNGHIFLGEHLPEDLRFSGEAKNFGEFTIKEEK